MLRFLVIDSSSLSVIDSIKRETIRPGHREGVARRLVVKEEHRVERAVCFLYKLTQYTGPIVKVNIHRPGPGSLSVIDSIKRETIRPGHREAVARRLVIKEEHRDERAVCFLYKLTQYTSPIVKVNIHRPGPGSLSVIDSIKRETIRPGTAKRWHDGWL